MKKIWLVFITVIFAAAMLAAQTKPDKQTTTQKSGSDITSSQASDTGYSKGKVAPSGEISNTATGKKSAAHGKLDINSASKDELEQLHGIGPMTAQKIIDGRPYRAKSDLVSKKIVTKGEYAKIKDQIVAHQTTSATNK